MTRNAIYFLILTLLLLLLFAADIFWGSVHLSPGEVLGAFTGGESHSSLLVLNFRLPKAIMAVVAGMALSVSGLQMQTLFRNPLAGPYVLGVSSGASLGVALFLLGIPLLGAGSHSEILRNIGMAGAAWIGAAAVLLLVTAAASRLKDIMAVLILGMMIGAASTAIVELLQYLSSEAALKSFVVWTMGSLGGVVRSQLVIVCVVVAGGLMLSVYLIKPLNLLLLGENYAVTMGLRVRRARNLIFLSTVLLAGTVTAFCGPIAFIGIAVPHVARMLFRNADHRVLLPATMLLGAVLMLLCDIIAGLPGYDMVLPINTVTALLGIPVVIMVIFRYRR